MKSRARDGSSFAFPLALPHHAPHALFSLGLLSAGTSRRYAFAACTLTRREYRLRCSIHRPVNGVHIAPPQKREADSRGPPTAWYRDIFQLRDTRIRTAIARNNNRRLSLNQKLKLFPRKNATEAPRRRGVDVKITRRWSMRREQRRYRPLI